MAAVLVAGLLAGCDGRGNGTPSTSGADPVPFVDPRPPRAGTPSERRGETSRGGLVVTDLAPRSRAPATPAPGGGEGQSEGEARTLLTRLDPGATGVEFQNRLVLDHPMRRLYHSGFVCGGSAIGDVDGDGRPDLFFTSGPGENRLYRQAGGVGELRFEDITAAAGVGGGEEDWATGAALADIDGDGDLDLYVCHYEAPNALYLNDGQGRFQEAAGGAGLALVDACLMPSFCDYDGDGDLDVFVLTNRSYRAGGRPAEPPVIKLPGGKVAIKPEFERYYGLKQVGPSDFDMDEVGRPDYLLRNDSAPGGPPRFSDVGRAAGVGMAGFGLSATWWDYNGDGRMDLYVANDFTDPDRLFRNDGPAGPGGEVTFTDVIAGAVNYTPWFSMGADAGDVDNDGRPDLIALDMAATTHYKAKVSMGEMGSMQAVIERIVPRQVMRNCLFLNTGTGRFLESAALSGVAQTDWSWAAVLADFDLDGRLDLFVSNGMARAFNHADIAFSPADMVGQTEWDHYADTPPLREQNLAFRNRGDLRFEDVSGAWGLDHVGMSYAAPTGDLDGDGDLDLVVVNLDEPVSIYRNDAAAGHRITVRLRGRGANTAALGARVEVSAGGLEQVREMLPVRGFLSSHQPRLHFGLGGAETVARLAVRWPGGRRQVFRDLAADKHYEITEPGAADDGGGTAVDDPAGRAGGGLAAAPDTDRDGGQPPGPGPLFVRERRLRGIIQQERLFDDFIRQPLLPHKLSQLGPGIAFADVDGDGGEDFFIGCPRGQSGAVFLNDGSGNFRVGAEQPFDRDEEAEDMGVLFFDADADGDPDLYVASGSYEYEPGDPLVRDRLYLNRGAGEGGRVVFEKSPPEALPDHRDNASCVAAADFDRDGDLDLFVGGRVVSGEYPLPAASHLLLNETPPGGPVHFTAAPEERAPGLARSGLVTAALWSDTDGDGWVDLLVALEWGPVKVFRNTGGRLVDATAEAGLSRWTGWWNSLAGGDVDNDGDIDYLVGNAGLNTKYRASPEEPAQIFYGAFTPGGRPRLIEAEFERGTLFPGRGKSCSTRAMPHLAAVFGTYHDFARAPLAEVYDPLHLGRAERFEANTLASGLLVNDGAGRFDFRPLPNRAQTAPIFGLALCDVDTDGMLDAFGVQNFSGPQFETPPYTGGLSILLKGDGGGGFEPVPSERSGLLVPGDGRGLAVTDLDGDGRPDFVVGVNQGEMLAFLNRCGGDLGGGGGRNRAGESAGEPRPQRIRLAGPPGNPRAAGARVDLGYRDGRRRAAEVYQGSGYLSQSTPTLFVGPSASRATVRWPDGAVTDHDLGGGGKGAAGAVTVLAHPRATSSPGG